jgi:hypothetical protein
MYKIIGADQKEYGPVSADQLRQWVVEGRVNGQTKVQAPAMTEWKAIADLPEFADIFPKTQAPALTPPTPISPPPPPPASSQLALWSMITGICSLFCCCAWFLVAPLAIVFGAVALSHLKNHPELTGRGFAILGIVLGIVAIVIWASFTVFIYLNPDFVQNLQKSMQP